MLSDLLRIELILLAVVAFIIVGTTVTKKIMQLKYAFIWFVSSFLLTVIAIFPQIVFRLTSFLGIQTPSNFIFLIAIFAILGICFSFSLIVSKNDRSIRRLVQTVSIENFESDEKDTDDKQENHYDC